jgi:hypothetical protein
MTRRGNTGLVTAGSTKPEPCHGLVGIATRLLLPAGEEPKQESVAYDPHGDNAGVVAVATASRIDQDGRVRSARLGEFGLPDLYRCRCEVLEQVGSRPRSSALDDEPCPPHALGGDVSGGPAVFGEHARSRGGVEIG